MLWLMANQNMKFGKQCSPGQLHPIRAQLMIGLGTLPRKGLSCRVICKWRQLRGDGLALQIHS